MTTPQRTRLSLLLIVLTGTIAVPALASTAAGVELFRNDPRDELLFMAPPPILFVIVGLSMVVWAVGRRHLKSVAAVHALRSGLNAHRASADLLRAELPRPGRAAGSARS